MSRTRRVWRRVGVLSTWFLGLFAVFMVLAVTLFYTLSDVPSPDTIKLQQTALIQYSDGTTLAEHGSVDRTSVPLSQVSESVKWAVLAAEDRKFYSEPGVSVKGTLRAALSDLTGGDTQGGSGITQQYVKNAYLNSSRTLTRKLKELAISLKLARSYSKDQILEWYLNTVYFGRNAWGIEAAAETYFKTTAAKLNDAQAAMLAGLLRSPNYYDPANNLSESTARWHYVLDGMVSTGHLTAAANAAMTFPAFQPDSSGQSVTSGPNGLIERQVLDEVAADGITADQLATGGLRIQTTINKTAQSIAVDSIAKAYANPSAKQANLQKSLVAINPADGSVIAYYGGSVGTDLDYASQAWRQPGSTFKPYVLATALTQNLAGTQPAYTIQSKFDGASPQVIDGQKISNDPTDPSSGIYSLTQAMTLSLNTVFYKLASDVGPTNVAATAHAVGIPKTNNGTPTLQLNGTTDDRIGIGGYEVRPIDQAVGYATLANGGTYHQSYFVQKITNAAGVVLYQHKTTGTKALDPKVANDTTLSMEQVASSSSIGVTGHPVAAKTGTVGIGTTSDSSDAWTVGFTPQISVASWAGSNGVEPIYNDAGTSMYGRQNPGKAWQLFMNAYLHSAPVAAMPTKQQIGIEAPATSSPPPTSSSSSSTSASSTPPSSPSSTPTPTPTKSKTPTPTPTPTPSTSTTPPPATTPPAVVTPAAKPTAGAP